MSLREDEEDIGIWGMFKDVRELGRDPQALNSFWRNRAHLPKDVRRRLLETEIYSIWKDMQDQYLEGQWLSIDERA